MGAIAFGKRASEIDEGAAWPIDQRQKSDRVFFGDFLRRKYNWPRMHARKEMPARPKIEHRVDAIEITPRLRGRRLRLRLWFEAEHQRIGVGALR